MMAADVVVVGSLHLDIVVNAPGRPRLGETMVGSGWALRPGGKGGNQAVAAARHGAQVAMVGAVGADEFGQRLLDHLGANGVDTAHVTVGRGESGMSMALVEPSGDYGAVIVSGVNLTLDAGQVTAAGERIGQAKCLVLQNEIPLSANQQAAELARKSGGTVMLNAAPARPLPPELAAVLDIIVVNALEAEALTGDPVADAGDAARAATALLRLVPCAIVTAGGAGLAAADRAGLRLVLPGYAVEVVSTLGAGDGFIGALAAQLAQGSALPDALRYANAAAALIVSTRERDRATLGPASVARMQHTALVTGCCG